MNRRITEVNENIKIATQRHDHLLSLLKRKTEDCDAESSSYHRTLEKLTATQAKLDHVFKTGDQNIIQQLEDYKKLLKCQSCQHNYKSHVLLQCMHTFW